MTFDLPGEPPQNTNWGDLNPNARKVSRHAPEQESGHALVGAGDLHHGQAQIPVGVVLEVSVSNAGQAEYQSDRWFDKSGANRVRVEQSHFWITASAFSFGGIGEAGRDI